MKALTIMSCLAIAFAALNASASNADCPARAAKNLVSNNDYAHLRDGAPAKQQTPAPSKKSKGTDGAHKRG